MGKVPMLSNKHLENSLNCGKFLRVYYTNHAQ